MKKNGQKIESEVRDLFMSSEADRQLIMNAWDQISPDQKQNHPEMAFQAAKMHLRNGELTEAGQCLNICLDVWQGDSTQQARTYLMFAQLHLFEKKYPAVQDSVKKVRDNSDAPYLIAESECLLGQAHMASHPHMAFEHFKEAIRLFKRIRQDDPRADFDLARVHQYAADAASLQNMTNAILFYQRQAEELARKVSNEGLLSWILIRKGDALERQGEYTGALESYNEAAQVSRRVLPHKEQARYHRANLALLMSDDTTAEELLKPPIEVDDVDTRSQTLMAKSWLAACMYNLDDAVDYLNEVKTLATDDEILLNRTVILECFIAAQQQIITADAIQKIQTSIEFFSNRRMYIEASQSNLMLAWMYALQGDYDDTRQLMKRVETQIQILGHSRHLARIYQASIAILGGWWSDEYRKHLENLPGSQASDKIYVYGFGIPRVFIGQRELKERDRYKRIGVQLLLFMLEHREATVEEVVNAIYPDVDLNSGKKRLFTLMGNFKKKMGSKDWCTYEDSLRKYVVREDFPHYYDCHDFDASYELFQNTTDSVQKIAQCIKLINLYAPYADRMGNQTLYEIGSHYEERYREILIEAKDLLPQLVDHVPEGWYEQLETLIAKEVS